MKNFYANMKWSRMSEKKKYVSLSEADELIEQAIDYLNQSAQLLGSMAKEYVKIKEEKG